MNGTVLTSTNSGVIQNSFWMISSRWMRSTVVCEWDLADWLESPDSQCRSRNYPGCDPSIFRHSVIWAAADEAVLNKVLKNWKKKKKRGTENYRERRHEQYLCSVTRAADLTADTNGKWRDEWVTLLMQIVCFFLGFFFWRSLDIL